MKNLYKKKSEKIEALKFDGSFESAEMILKMLVNYYLIQKFVENENVWYIGNYQGLATQMHVPANYWVVQINGSAFACSENYFNDNFEKIETLEIITTSPSTCPSTFSSTSTTF